MDEYRGARSGSTITGSHLHQDQPGRQHPQQWAHLSFQFHRAISPATFCLFSMLMAEYSTMHSITGSLIYNMEGFYIPLSSLHLPIWYLPQW